MYAYQPTPVEFAIYNFLVSSKLNPFSYGYVNLKEGNGILKSTASDYRKIIQFRC
jgi:hypothetical protein